MSVFAYFAPIREPRMPRATSQPDPLNISWHGPVLEGQLTVRHAFEKSDIQARMPSPPVRVRGYEPRPFRPA